MATTKKTVKKETTKKTEPAKTPAKKTTTVKKAETKKKTVEKKAEPVKAAAKKAEPVKVPEKKTAVKKSEPVKKAPAKKTVKKTPEKKEPERIKAEDMAPATPTIDSFPTIQRGAKGAYVTLLQANLMNRGYKISAISGNFDDETFAALKEFKRDNGLPINGIVGPKVWEMIRTSKVQAMPSNPEKVEAPAAAPAEIKMEAPAVNPEDLHFQPIANPKTSLVIEGLTRYQAELLAKMFKGGIECRIVESR